LRIGGGGGFWSEVQVEDGWGKNGQVILSGTELLRFTRVGESLGVQVGVAKHFFRDGMIKRTMGGGVESVLGGGGGWFGQWG